MKTTIEVKLMPFKVPNFVLTEEKPGRREDGFKETPKYRLSDLDSDTLSKLCDDFRDSVFKKADKSQPPMPG